MAFFRLPRLQRGRHSRRASALRGRRRLRIEPLERRDLLATLGLGIHLRLDDDGAIGGSPVPGEQGLTTSVRENQVFWVDIVVEDQRTNAAGIIGLPLNLSWDPNHLELLNPPTQFFPNNVEPAELVTDRFPRDRFVNAYDPQGGLNTPPDPNFVPVIANIDSIRGASIPNLNVGEAIGIPADPMTPPVGDPEFVLGEDPGFVFGQLQFRALSVVDDTPFTLQVAGSMSFADADILDRVDQLTVALRQNRDPRSPVISESALAVTEFLDIKPVRSSLSGFVYADTNLDGMFNADEIGLPDVTITLGDGASTIDTTTTGPDGWYHFEDLVAGTYSITETQPDGYVSATNTLGTIVAPPGVAPPAASGIVGNNMFSNIVLMDGEHGIDYNFGENLLPTKRMFLASTNPRLEHFTQLGVTAEFIEGTDANDAIVVQATADEIQVTVNGIALPPVAIAESKIVVVDAGAGQDTLTLTGSDEGEVAHLLPNSASFRRGADFEGLNYGVLVINAEDVTANGGGGNDLAVFRDTTLNDDFIAGNGDDTGNNTAMLTSTDLDLIARAMAFEKIRAISAAGGADTAAENLPFDFELDLLGNWMLVT